MNNKKKHNKVSLYEKLQFIRQKNCLSLVFRFSKVNVFHITLECLISVYMLELLSVLSKFFLIDPTNISSLFMLIVFPCVTMIPLSVVFGIVFLYPPRLFLSKICCTQFLKQCRGSAHPL